MPVPLRVFVDGILVNGVDLIKWDAPGKIVEFKVLIQPLKAINLIHERMGVMLKVMREQRQLYLLGKSIFALPRATTGYTIYS